MRLLGSMSVLAFCFVTAAFADQAAVQDAKGKTLALIYDCSGCESPKAGESCPQGVENGFDGGKPCGQCLLDANFGTRIAYGYDLLLRGYLKDDKGEPIVGRYVKLSLPNTWSYRTRTLKDGLFQLALGATSDREGETRVIDLGVRTISSGDPRDYLMFMLPPDHKPCQQKGD